jgi:hypothetical protein
MPAYASPAIALELLMEGNPMPHVDRNTGEILESAPTAGEVVIHSASSDLERRAGVAGALRPVESPAALLEAQEATRALVAELLVEGRDFGTIPGTKKRTLLQPGAQRVAGAFGCMALTEIVEAEVDHDRVTSWEKKRKLWKNREFVGYERETGTATGLYRYMARCRLIHRGTGVEVGEGFGICSSLEDRYVDRPRDLEHTIMRMAKKRALVDAVLQTFSLSEQFEESEEARADRNELPPEETLKIARGRYHSLLAELIPHPEIRELCRQAYQEAHPRLPDSSSSWEAQHFERAAAEFEKFGADTFTRAVKWKAQDDPASPVDLELLDAALATRNLGEEESELTRWLREAGVSSWIRRALPDLGPRVGAEESSEGSGEV